MILLDILLLLMVAALIRITPTLMVKHGAGVDQWYWKAYIESDQAIKYLIANPVRHHFGNI